MLSGRIIGEFSRDISSAQQKPVATSECDECQGLTERMSRIEEKLDTLLRMQLGAGEMPGWFAKSEGRLLTAVAEMAGSFSHISSTCNSLRKNVEDMADGADRFLAGIKAKLTKPESDLFFEMIATVHDGSNRKIQTYSDIGSKLGVSKQAVQKRYKKLCTSHPAIAEYIGAIRTPQKADNFSELSPTERRKRGVDESYNYDER